MCNARDFEPEKKTLQTICTKMEKKNNLVNNLDNLFLTLDCLLIGTYSNKKPPPPAPKPAHAVHANHQHASASSSVDRQQEQKYESSQTQDGTKLDKYQGITIVRDPI
jgi:hypothetical protein